MEPEERADVLEELSLGLEAERRESRRGGEREGKR